MKDKSLLLAYMNSVGINKVYVDDTRIYGMSKNSVLMSHRANINFPAFEYLDDNYLRDGLYEIKANKAFKLSDSPTEELAVAMQKYKAFVAESVKGDSWQLPTISMTEIIEALSFNNDALENFENIVNKSVMNDSYDAIIKLDGSCYIRTRKAPFAIFILDKLPRNVMRYIDVLVHGATL